MSLPEPQKCESLKHDEGWERRLFNDSYTAQQKLDGCRVLLEFGTTSNIIWSGGRDVSDHFPHLQNAVLPKIAGTILDGELTASGEKGEVLCSATALLTSTAANARKKQATYGDAYFNAFDVLQTMGTPVMGLDYMSRNNRLNMILEKLSEVHPDCKIFKVWQYLATEEIVTEAKRMGWEGLVFKKKDSKYQPGKRDHTGWYKLKFIYTADAFVTGYVPGENANAGLVGSLELSIYIPVPESMPVPAGTTTALIDGVEHVPVPIAKVGNFTDRNRRALSNPDGSLKEEFYGDVIEFEGQCVGVEGHIRHPLMVRWRPDKLPNDCTDEQLKGFPRG